jgi:hypothetical protein
MRLAVVFLGACGGGGGAKLDAAGGLDAPGDAAADVAIDAARCPSKSLVDTGAQSEVSVAGDTPAMGIFDPSVVYPGGAPGGAMAYSAVPDQMTIRTHIAVSTDSGATWTYVAEANAPELNVSETSTDTTECPGGACTGNLISEVSSLVYDADEPDAQKMWKLFAHRYLVGANVNLHYRIGTITLQTAPAPDGPWTAPAKLIGWNSPAPYSSTGVVANVSTLPGTARDCLALTEPGAIWLPGVLDLAVGCVYLDGGAPKIRIELLRSTDHAASWLSVGTLLRPSDASCLTVGASINAADLFAHDGAEYVAATPSDGSGYHGCTVFAIDDPVSGHAHATPSRLIDVTPTAFAGACTFAEVTGYYLDVGAFSDTRKFRIYRSGITTP